MRLKFPNSTLDMFSPRGDGRFETAQDEAIDNSPGPVVHRRHASASYTPKHADYPDHPPRLWISDEETTMERRTEYRWRIIFIGQAETR